MALAQATIGTGVTTIHTSSGQTATTAMFFMNDNASARTINIYAIPSGGSAAGSNQLVKNVNIDGGDTYVLNTEKIILDNGDTIRANASAGSSVYATISYVTI